MNLLTHPIIERELIAFLRTRRAQVLQIGLAVVFGAIVLLRWPTDARVGLSGERALDVFRVFGYGLFIALLLMGPIFPATSIVRERIKGTLALLLTSPMGPVSIYLGKLIGVVGLATLLLAMSFPAAAACYAMGGISLTGDLLALYALLLLMVLQIGSLALLISSYANSIDSSVRLTYGAILVLAVVTLGPYQFLQGSGGWLAYPAGWLRCISPIPAVMTLLGQGDVGSRGLEAGFDPVWRYVLLASLCIVGFSAWTISRLNHQLLDRSRSAGQISNELDTSKQVLRRLFFLVDPQRRKMGIPWFINPVMVKEFRTRRFGRLEWLVRIVAVCATLSLGLTLITTMSTETWDVDTIGGIMVVLQVALIVLFTPSLAAGLISTERESGGWDLLRMTPLSAFRIILGKLFSVIWPVALIMLATLPGYIVMIQIQPTVRPQVELVVTCLGMTALLGVAVSAAISSLFRKTATATVVAYAVLLSIYAGSLLIWMGRDFPFSHDMVEKALTINPMAAAFSVIEVGGFEKYDLLPANWWFVGITSAVAFLVLFIQTWRLSRPT